MGGHELKTLGKIKKRTISARVIRANGQVEELGVISSSSIFWEIKKWVKNNF